MNKTSSKRPIIFLGVGIVNTLLDFAFYTFLTSFIFTDNNSIAIAGIVSGTFALICAFLTHGFITWHGRNLSTTTILRFFIFTGFGMWVIRPILLALFIHLTPVYNFAYNISSALGLPFSQDFIANTGAFGFMAVIVLLYNYVVYDRFVFKKSSEE